MGYVLRPGSGERGDIPFCWWEYYVVNSKSRYFLKKLDLELPRALDDVEMSLPLPRETNISLKVCKNSQSSVLNMVAKMWMSFSPSKWQGHEAVGHIVSVCSQEALPNLLFFQSRASMWTVHFQGVSLLMEPFLETPSLSHSEVCSHDHCNPVKPTVKMNHHPNKWPEGKHEEVAGPGVGVGGAHS